MSDTIPRAHYWPTNAHLIADVAQLRYLDGSVLDLTFGKHGGFWKQHRPAELVTNDLRHPADHSWDFRDVPMSACSFDNVVLDPDYKLNGTPALGEQDERYGVDENKTRAERMDDIRRGSIEAFRLCRQRALVKCQDQTEGGKVRWQTDMVTTALEELGARKIDRFDFLYHPRKQPANRTRKHAACKGTGCDDCDGGREPSEQQTAESNYSTLLVFWKPAALRKSSEPTLL